MDTQASVLISITSPFPVFFARIGWIEQGQFYLFCQCGFSKKQPFCDGSHHGTTFRPLRFQARKSGPARLCACKRTQAGPFCDDSHLQ